MMVKTIPKSFPIAPRLRPNVPGAITQSKKTWPAKPQIFCSRFGALVRLRLKDEVDGLCLRTRDGHFLILLTVGFMPCRHCVLSRRQVRQAEAAILTGNSVVRILEYCKVAVHPGMDVALHGDKLGLIVFVDNGRSARGLRLVPLAIDLGKWMDVVGSLVVVDNFQRLIHLKSEHVGNVLAAFLVKLRVLRWRGIVWGTR